MPIYMDVHRLEGGVTPLEVEQAHLSDLEAQEKYGVRYLKYWFNQEAGSVFCLIDAPEPDAAVAVHREAHGMIADKLIQVDEVVLNAFLCDGGEKPAGAAALLPGGDGQTLDGGLRIILFTDLEGSTATTNRLGDAEAMKVLRSHNASSAPTMPLCARRSPSGGARRSNIPATASWPHSSRAPTPPGVLSRFSRGWPSTTVNRLLSLLACA